MSLYTQDHTDAVTALANDGAAVTFTRLVPGPYDAATDTSGAPFTVTVTGRALEAPNPTTDTDRFAPALEKAQSLRSMFFVPDTYGASPQPGDTATWGGLSYTVADVDPIAPDGTFLAGYVMVAGAYQITLVATVAMTRPGPALAATGSLIFSGSAALTRPGPALAAQGSNGTVFTYTPGDSVAGKGGTFTRATSASYYDVNGVLQSAASGVLRDGHYVGGVQTSRLEATARTNICLQSETFDSATWTKVHSSISANADTAPDGTVSGDRIVEDATAASAHLVSQSLTITANADVTFSCFMKAGTRTWAALQVSDSTSVAAGHTFFDLQNGIVGGSTNTGVGVVKAARMTLLPNGWYRCSIVVNVGGGFTIASARVFLASANNGATYSGDGTSYLSVWGAQVENNASFESAYIPTTTTSLPRNADVLSFPFAYVPQAMTFYVKFIERGTIPSAGRVLQISADGDDINALVIAASTTAFSASIRDAGGAVLVSSGLVSGPSIGQLVELRVTISATGVITIAQTLDGGVETVAGASAPTALPGAWGAQKLHVFQRGGSLGGFGEVESIKIAQGVQSLSFMRAA